MTKSEREKLRDLTNKFFASGEKDYMAFTAKEISALLDHVDALEGQVDDAGFITIPVRATWLLQQKPEGYLDHACRYCVPDGPMVHKTFVCAYHIAEQAIASAQECKTCNGKGLFINAENRYQSDPCPDCNEEYWKVARKHDLSLIATRDQVEVAQRVVDALAAAQAKIDALEGKIQDYAARKRGMISRHDNAPVFDGQTKEWKAPIAGIYNYWDAEKRCWNKKHFQAGQTIPAEPAEESK